MTLSVDSRINQNNQRIFNGGYLAIRNLCYEIGLNEICVDIAKKEKLKGDLFQILVNLICVNVMVEGKTLETSELAKTFIEQPRYTKRQFYQAIEIFAKYDYYIQIQMLDKETQDWIFDEEGWRNIFTNKEYNLFDIRKVLERYDDPDYCNKYIEKFKKYLDIT